MSLHSEALVRCQHCHSFKEKQWEISHRNTYDAIESADGKHSSLGHNNYIPFQLSFCICINWWAVRELQLVHIYFMGMSFWNFLEKWQWWPCKYKLAMWFWRWRVERLKSQNDNHSLLPSNSKIIKYPNPVVHNTGCTLESLGKLQNYKLLHPTPSDCDDLIGLGCGLGFGRFKRSPGYFNVQTRMGKHSLNWRIITLASH